MSVLTTSAGNYPKIGDSTEEQKLRRALHQLDKGEISDEDLEKVLAEVTQEVVREQIEAGIDLVTDGRIRWSDAVTYQAGKIVGFKMTGLIRYFDTNTFYREPIVESRVEAGKPFLVEDYKFAASVSSKPVKAVLTGPYTLARLSKNTFYREFSQLAYDLAHIIHREAKALEDAGCPVIQFDEPAIVNRKEDWKLFERLYEIVAVEITKAEKILFLNFGHLEGIYPKVFNLAVDTIGCELTRNHPNWSILKTSPFEKKLMAGIVDARNTKMETEAELAEVVQRLSEIVPFEKLSVSPSHGLEFLPRSVAKKKLAVLAASVKSFKETKVSQDVTSNN